MDQPPAAAFTAFAYVWPRATRNRDRCCPMRHWSWRNFDFLLLNTDANCQVCVKKLFGDSGVDFGSIQVDNDNNGHHKDITTNFIHKKKKAIIFTHYS